jgi:hypothetical protein
LFNHCTALERGAGIVAQRGLVVVEEASDSGCDAFSESSDSRLKISSSLARAARRECGGVAAQGGAEVSAWRPALARIPGRA